MHRLLTIGVMLVLYGCAAPQEQALKQMPSAFPAQAGKPVSCTTIRDRVMTSRTVCN